MKDESNKFPTIKEVFPDFSDEKLEEVEARLEEHIRIAMDTQARLAADPVAYAEFRAALTKLSGGV